MKEHYADKEELLNLIMEWKEDRTQGKVMNNRFAELIYLIVRGVMKKPMYQNVQPAVKDELMSDAVLNVILYVHNFNITKSRSKNAAFTYITFAAENTIRNGLKKNNERNGRYTRVSDFHDSLEPVTFSDYY